MSYSRVVNEAGLACHPYANDRVARRLSPPNAPWLHLLLLAFLVVAATFHARLDEMAIDSFHEGEYAVYGSLAGGNATDAPPLFIHGGIDHIPPRLAAVACPEGRQIVCIRTINAGFIAATAAAYFTVLGLITGLGTWSALTAGVPAMLTLVIYNGGATSIVRLQQGSPSIRELFIMLMLIGIALLSLHADRFAVWTRLAVVSALGLLAGLGLFWAYNRGLAAVILAGCGTAAFAAIWRDWRPLMFLVAGGVIGVAVADALNLYGGLAGNVSNVLYWMRNDKLFWLRREDIMLLSLVPHAIVITGLLGFGGLLTWLRSRRGHPARAVLPAALLGLVALYALQIYPRPDWVHLSWLLGPAALLAAILIRALEERATSPFRRTSIALVSLAASIAMAPDKVVGIVSAPERWAGGIIANIATLTAPLPADADLVSPGLREAAAVIRAHGARCTYAFSNEGLFYLLSRLTPCSRFAYPAYVAPEFQKEVIAELTRNQPPIVLARSVGWWNDIDGLGLAERTPVLARWMTSHYPYRMRLDGGYELRSIEALPNGGP